MLDLDELPPRIVFVGGGYVSFELAHLAARAGAHVEIAHANLQPLEQFDPDLVDRLVATTRSLGIAVHLDAPAKAIERANGAVRVHLCGRDALLADLAVHSAGRVPEIDDLDLPAASVARTAKGVAVNEHLQSRRRQHPRGKSPQRRCPRACEHRLHYPAAGFVGLTEREARKQGYDVDVRASETTAWLSSARLATRASTYKTVLETKTGRILGATIFGPHTEELVNVFALAIRRRAGLRVAGSALRVPDGGVRPRISDLTPGCARCEIAYCHGERCALRSNGKGEPHS